MRTKSKLLIGMLLLTFSISLLAFSYRPDTWSTCLDETAIYLDGTEAPLIGYCDFAGYEWMENHEVETTKCQPTGSDEPNCPGNGALIAVTLD